MGTTDMFRMFLSVGAALLVAATADAQPPDRPGGRGGFGGPPGFHLMEALDVDKDGKMSKREIENAVVSLRKLDKDQDGKLSSEEIGWPPSFGRGRGRGGFGRGGFPGFGEQPEKPRRPNPDGEAVDASASTSGSSAARRRFFSASQLERLDRDGDGRISKTEIPKQMQELILGRLDKNKDGLVDQAEFAQFAKEPEELK